MVHEVVWNGGGLLPDRPTHAGGSLGPMGKPRNAERVRLTDEHKAERLKAIGYEKQRYRKAAKALSGRRRQQRHAAQHHD